MSDFLVEVDEALKQERLENLWKKYGGFLLAFLAALILGTAMNAGYKTWTSAHNQKQTSLFLGVLNKEKPTAQDFLDIAPKLSGSLRGVAEIQAAGIALENGDKGKALELYQNVSNAGYADDVFLDLAQYMLVKLSDSNTSDKVAKLGALQENEGNPWRFHAMLDLALVHAVEREDYASARKLLKSVINASMAPKTLQQKAQSLDIVYAIKEKKHNSNAMDNL